MDPPQRASSRKVYPPLLKLDKCCKCGATIGLRLCASCRERIYCSSECQKEDWTDHRRVCKQTEQIDLGRFWPFFGYLSEVCRIDPARPVHPALMRKIVNNPIPNETYEVVNGVATNPVILGDPIWKDKSHQMTSLRTWWPSAISDQMRRKLFSRIMREGYSVPILLSILVALMAEMYTTTHNPEKDAAGNPEEGQISHNKRFRLQCEGHPIVDFGICKGRAQVKEMDTLGYFTDFYRDPTKFLRGQDPRDHYWIYFKTSREEFTLDLCLFTFNFGFCVLTPQYQPRHLPGCPDINDAGAFFLTRAYRKATPMLQWETQRLSVLHNEELQAAVSTPSFSEADESALIEFMDRLVGRSSTEREDDFLISWTASHRRMLASTLYHKEFLQYPADPSVGIKFDPGQEAGMRPPIDEQDDAERYIRRKSKLARKGRINADQLVEDLRAWHNFSPEEKNAKGGHDRRRG